MLIMHAFHHYYPFLGGMERAILGLAEEQVKFGHDVHIVTSTYGAEGRPVEETLNGVHIRRVKAWRLRYPDLTIPREIPVELLKKPDVVHVHGQNSLFSMKMLEKASALRVKTACYFMAVNAFADHPSMFIRFLGSYYGRRNAGRALKLAELVLVKSIRDKEILKEVYGAEATYLPDAIPDYYFTLKKRNPEEFNEKFGIKQEKIFLFIGRMHRLKGPHILVKALKYVNENIAVVFIGPDGGYLKETLNLAERIGVRDKVYALGYVDEETKIHALDSAVALILPSIADYVEVYPMVISEAWARKKPVIASKVGGIPYRIRNGVNGLLVEISSPQSLAEAMSELLDDDELSGKMGVSGREDVLSWREVAMKSVKLYKQTLAE